MLLLLLLLLTAPPAPLRAAGKPTLARMTGCWDDAYEMYSWSNVVCVPRSHAMYPVMEKMTLRYEQHRERYYQGGGAGSGGGGGGSSGSAAAAEEEEEELPLA